MKTIYQVEIIEIGSLAREGLEDNMMIIFGDIAPRDIRDYCFVHNHGDLIEPLTTKNTLKINDQVFSITAIGDVVNKNLAELGHITLRFDGSLNTEYPGCVHLNGSVPKNVTVGCKLSFQ